MNDAKSLDTIAGALSYAMGIAPPAYSAAAHPLLCEYIDEKLFYKKADRVFMYNPDAIAQWVYEKYPSLLSEAVTRTDIKVPLETVMPSVTPVCFATMYTGTQPEVHGIRKYTKPVLTTDTIFDSLIRSGKKPAIVSTENDSMSKIFLERNMDYYIYDSVEKVNAKAAQLIIEDKYDFIAVYNGNFDSTMHKFGPESKEALAELRANSRTFGMLYELICENWKRHNTLIGFAMDHGCHEIDGDCGSHGLDMEEDINIVHFYKAISKTE